MNHPVFQNQEVKDSYTKFYWAVFSDDSKACIQGNTAKEAIENCGKSVVKIDSLPYPASKQIGPKVSDCPAFCHSPESCKGRTACPQRHSCTE